MPVAGIGPRPQPVHVAVLGQQQVQPLGGIHVAGIGPGAQPVHVAALGQQVGQLAGGVLVADVGPGAQYPLGPVQVAALGQQDGQLLGSILIVGVGGVMVQRDGVAVQQPVFCATRESGVVGGVANVAEDGVPGVGGHAGGATFAAGVLDQVIRSN